MPAAITHYYHALKVWDNSKEKNSLKSIEAFLWGAQGPDFLYYHRALQPLKENLRGIGSRLHHETPSLLLAAMRNFQNTKGNDTVSSYISGFLCHYSLDRTIHPFVYWTIQLLREIYPGRGDGFLHNHTESVLDCLVHRTLTEKPVRKFDLKTTVPFSREVQDAMVQLYSYLLEHLYGIEHQQNELLQAMIDCRKICGLLNDPWILKKPILETLERATHKYLFSCFFRGTRKVDGFDYLNSAHSLWKWPENAVKVRNENFFDLFKNSIQESIDFIDKFKTADLSDLTHDIPFC